MSVFHNSALIGASGQAAGYTIDQSLRFNDSDSAHFSKTTTTGTRTAWTWSCWVKATRFDGAAQAIFGSAPASTLYNDIGFDNGQFRFRQYNSSGGGNSWELKTTARYRDPSAWYHIVLRFDTAQAISGDRVKIWINGDQVTDFASQTYPGQNIHSVINNQYEQGIGKLESTFNYYFDGYLAEMVFLDNDVTVTPTDFGEYDDNGVWRPIEYTGSYTGKSFYLKFDPSATNGIGHDHSGNGNHWTPTGFTTSGTGTDVMSDTPTTNFCTVNPLSQRQFVAFSEGNLQLNWNNSGSGASVAATMGLTSGKYYWETTITNGSSADRVGAISPDVDLMGIAGVVYFDQKTYSWSYRADGYTVNNSVSTNQSTTYTTGDVIGVAVDMDAGKIWFSKNGTFLNSGDPAAGTNAVYSTVTGTIIPAWSGYGEGGTTRVMTCNFGQRDFEYTPPTGFKALNTSNLPAPTIEDGSKYFEAVTYTGDGNSTQQITTSFEPDFVWNKNRGAAYSHRLFDRLRGTLDKALYSNATYNEDQYTDYGEVTATSATSVTVGQGSDSNNLINASSNTYVMWNWLAGGSGSSNTDGILSSTVSANPTAGFSIVTWTAPSSSQTNSVGHGLGVAPSFVICKSRSGGSGSLNWSSYHVSLGKDKYINLESTGAAVSASNYWGASGMTSTTIGLPTGSSSTGYNNNTGNMVAYCFAEVEGYSKFGSYTGNGNADGPFIYTGFAVRWLMWKKSSSTSNWVIWDAERHPYNPADSVLFPNNADAEGTNAAYNYDLLSNGFKVRTGSATINDNGATYIFAAFASNPFGGSGVSPVTAR